MTTPWHPVLVSYCCLPRSTRMSATVATASQREPPGSSSMSLDPVPPPPPSTSSQQHIRPLRFHPPTSTPHIQLQPDHLTVTHTGPGNHTSDHSLLHTDRPITFPPPPPAADVSSVVDVYYWEVKLLNAGKKGEVYVGLVTGDSPAIDTQLAAAIRGGKVKDGPVMDKRSTDNGAGRDRDRDSSEDDEEEEEELIELPAPSFASDRLWPNPIAASHPAASLSQPTTAAPLAQYSSSAQRQLGLEHPQSFSIQLTHGRLFSMQHTKGLALLPALTTGDTLGIGYVHNALSSTAAPSSNGSALLDSVAAAGMAGTSAQPVSASSLTVSSYVFFTKNGRLIPDKELAMDHINATLAQHSSALTSQPSPLAALLFPAVTFHSPNESIAANFTPSTYLFDMAQYEAELRDRRWQLLAAVEDGKSGLLSLVREYLLYHGYDGTVAVLDESEVVEVDAKLRWTGGGSVVEGSSHKSSMEDRVVAADETALRSSLRVRGEVRQLIQSADVEGAVRRLRHSCPAVLRQRAVRFYLHSLHFINILTTEPAPAHAATDSVPSPLTPPSSALKALNYARRHLSPYLYSATLSRTLGRLMALLAVSPAEWSSNPLTGVEWRERVADIVNRAVLRHSDTALYTAAYSGSRRDSAVGDTDRMEDGDERREENGKDERNESKKARKNGAEMDDDLFGDYEHVDSQPDKEGEEEEEASEAEIELHGSQLEVLLAQLLAVNSLWLHQRPTLREQPLFPQDAVEQLRLQH